LDEGTLKGSPTPIKFPKYLKKVTDLTLHGIWHKDFTETMFDMANQRRLKQLNLSFVKDVPLPNFSEALLRFTSLTSLTLTGLDLRKINSVTFFEFLA
jgi:hypothetical protein